MKALFKLQILSILLRDPQNNEIFINDFGETVLIHAEYAGRLEEHDEDQNDDEDEAASKLTHALRNVM